MKPTKMPSRNCFTEVVGAMPWFDVPGYTSLGHQPCTSTRSATTWAPLQNLGYSGACPERNTRKMSRSRLSCGKYCSKSSESMA